ncbi:MAG: hypothetical protein RLZZ232_3262 [Planctomycetota bacterium]
MKSMCNPRSFRALCLATGLAILALQNAASAGVLSYNSSTGGTFDPSSPSTFTFTSFPAGFLSPGVAYNQARVVMRWGGATSNPGAFDITGVAINSATTALGDLQFLATTASGTLIENSYVGLNSTLTDQNVQFLTLTLTIPTLSVPTGFFLEVAVRATDGAEINRTAFQKVTAIAPVPEPSVGILAGCVASAIWYARRRRSLKA